MQPAPIKPGWSRRQVIPAIWRPLPEQHQAASTAQMQQSAVPKPQQLVIERSQALLEPQQAVTATQMQQSAASKPRHLVIRGLRLHWLLF